MKGKSTIQQGSKNDKKTDKLLIFLLIFEKNIVGLSVENMFLHTTLTGMCCIVMLE
jgi:hypothetical protein